MAETNKKMPAEDNGNSGMWKKIKQLEKEEFERGEIVKVPNAIFHFPFLQNASFLNSPNKSVLVSLAGPENTVHHAQEVIQDLEIKKSVIITREIPTGYKRRNIIPFLGIGGRALSDTEVELYFDPNHANVVESLSSWSGRQIAHELNHVARWQAHAMKKTLLDAIISEGLATYYEERWGGKYLETKWGHALNQTQTQGEWQRAQKELDFANYNYGDWFFGSDKGHPLYSGYSIGTTIVGDYFKRNPRQKMADVVKIPSKKVLKKSGFGLQIVNQ